MQRRHEAAHEEWPAGGGAHAADESRSDGHFPTIGPSSGLEPAFVPSERRGGFKVNLGGDIAVSGELTEGGWEIGVEGDAGTPAGDREHGAGHHHLVDPAPHLAPRRRSATTSSTPARA